MLRDADADYDAADADMMPLIDVDAMMMPFRHARYAKMLIFHYAMPCHDDAIIRCYADADDTLITLPC